MRLQRSRFPDKSDQGVSSGHSKANCGLAWTLEGDCGLTWTLQGDCGLAWTLCGASGMSRGRGRGRQGNRL